MAPENVQVRSNAVPSRNYVAYHMTKNMIIQILTVGGGSSVC